MEDFDGIFGLVIDTKNWYKYNELEDGVVHRYTLCTVVGAMLVSFKRMEIKQVSLCDLFSTTINKYIKLSLTEDSRTRFLYKGHSSLHSDLEAPTVIIDRYKDKDGNKVENVKAEVLGVWDTGIKSCPMDEVIPLYDKSGKLRIRSGCDIVAYQCTDNIYLTVNLSNHSIEFTTESRLYSNSLCVKENYFGSYIPWDMLSSLQHGSSAVLICMGEAEVVKSCDSVILPSEVRHLYLDEYIDVNKIVCNKEVEHFDGYSNKVGEWFISKETSASFIVDLVKWCMEELLDDDDGSIATYGAEIYEKCNRLSELATELKSRGEYESFLRMLRKPENEDVMYNILSDLKVTVY